MSIDFSNRISGCLLRRGKTADKAVSSCSGRVFMGETGLEPVTSCMSSTGAFASWFTG